MLVPVNWLKDYVDIQIDIKEFANMMTLTGTNVEAIESRDAGIENVVAAKITEIKPHPDSDHMFVAMADDSEKIHTVVTGAQNVRQNDVVPLARNHSVIAGGKRIKSGTIRGIESEGMLCSAEELGINASVAPKDYQNGIYKLPADTPIGADVTKVLGLCDEVIDFELTNNRQDCNSILGIAAEASATLGKRFAYPKYEYNSGGNEIDKYLSIDVEDDSLCARYTARMVKIKKIEPSPLFIQNRLMSAGIRPINNVVDASNFVMLETGQPLHTFDYAKLGGGRIVVRRAKNGEKFTTLDGVERALTEDCLMIDDSTKHIALAGVMGGENSDISGETQLVVIESANFDRNSVRRTSKRLGLRTEASARFEKGISASLTKYAADRAASLLVEIGAAEYIGGIIDKFEALESETTLRANISDINRLIGVELTGEQTAHYLDLLGFDCAVSGDEISVKVPRFRQDIKIMQDLAEEVARMYGYNNIPTTMLNSLNFTEEPNLIYKNKQKIKSALIAAGGNEILTYSFISPSKHELMGFQEGDVRSDPVIIINPLGEDNSVMRTALLPGLLDALSLNCNRKHKPALMFELASVYYKGGGDEKGLPAQTDKLIIGKYGADYYEIKAVVKFLLASLKIENVKFTRADEAALHPARSAYVFAGEKNIGYIGQIHPKIAAFFELEELTSAAELDVGALIAQMNSISIKAVQIAKYPAVLRDIALVADDNISAGEIGDAIMQSAGKTLISCEVFDVYKSEALGSKKSIAYSLTFRSDEGTLTDEQTDDKIKNILKTLNDKYGIVLRS